ncbi:MAG TPA: Mur ligase domain-containing protein [Myxococcota bacterium]|nr:Mur ligase domain-containing protein [Myxococcota bacterium]
MHVHFVAIAGTGMGALAGLLKARGHEVTGSDTGVYPPMSTTLARLGIPVEEGFDADRVLARRPDLVVIGNAVRPDNPEARAALDAGLAVSSFPDALYEHAIRGKHSVVVAGTHGKTTTTSLLATLLYETGRDPSFLVGGVPANFDAGFREGAGPHFAVEGDEYDTVFFDKTPKFLHYHPRTLLLTSVEFDHADIYRDLAHVKSAFRTLVERLPADGTLVAALASPNVAEIAAAAPCRVVGYGVGEAADAGGLAWRAVSLQPDAAGTRFELVVEGRRAGTGVASLHGRHNLENVVGALATLAALGAPAADALRALPRFRGVKRRMEVRGEAGGVTLVDDFAHHPTAVRETLAALRARYPGRRLVAVFEPRSNTSRRAVFQREYGLAFDAADRVVVAAVPAAPIYSAFGEVTELFSADQLAGDLRARGRDAVALDGVDRIVADLVARAQPGDVVVTLSNGGFGAIWEKLLARLGDAGGARGATERAERV